MKSLLAAALILAMPADNSLTVKAADCDPKVDGCYAVVQLNGRSRQVGCSYHRAGCRGPLTVGDHVYDVLNDEENPYRDLGLDALRIHGETSNAIYYVGAN
jgi:hypothetical protein